jgi:hypothetical protein
MAVGSGGRFCHGGTIRQARRQTKGYHRPSRNRRIAGLSGFFTFSQSREAPDRYGDASRFDTMLSSPILQAWPPLPQLV